MTLAERGTVTKTHRNRKYLCSREKSHYTNKVKCSALKPTQNLPETVGAGKLILSLKDADDNLHCIYEPKTIEPKEKKTKGNVTASKKKSKTFKTCEKIKSSTKAIIVQEPKGFSKAKEVPLIEGNKNSLTVVGPSDKNEDNSKPFIGSFGSWINDLFSVPNKISDSAPKIKVKPLQQKTPPEENVEYFKSINVLKEEFRKKLRSETTIHIANGDSLLHFDFKNRKTKKRSKSASLGLFEQVLAGEEEDIETSNGSICKALRRQVPSELLRLPLDENEKEEKEISPPLRRLKNNSDLNISNLIKEKKKSQTKERCAIEELEEYFFLSPAEASKRLLLNMDDHEKCSLLYKNNPIGLQETQHCVQRKNKSYQNSTRCYTTTTLFGENLDNLNSSKLKNSHTASAIKRKTSAESTRNNSTYVKVGSQKSNSQVEFLKADSKASSDDLVKYLMKKVKVHPRSSPNKKKIYASTSSQINLSNKSKFMQSATSSMVNDVLSKKENDYLMPIKNGSRISMDKNDLYVRPDIQHKTWSIKYKDGNMSLDVKRPNNLNRLNRSTYLSDDSNELIKENHLYDRNLRKSNRLYDGSLRMEPKEASEKYIKRQEVQNMLSKLEFKSNLYRTAKVKQKEQKKRAVQNILDNLAAIDSKENFSGRFQHQHDLFKSSLKPGQTSDNLNSDLVKSTNENVIECDPPCPSTEIVCIDKGLNLIHDKSSGDSKHEVLEHPSKTLPTSKEAKENTDLRILDPIDNNLFNKPLDKHIAYQDKLCKTKLLQYAKEENIRALIDPLLENCVHEGIHLKGATTNVHEQSLSTQEPRTVKTIDRASGSRKRFSNSGNGSPKQKTKAMSLNYKGCSPALENDWNKRLTKEKKKDKHKKPQSDESQPSNHCGFEKKKSGPNCEDKIISL